MLGTGCDIAAPACEGKGYRASTGGESLGQVLCSVVMTIKQHREAGWAAHQAVAHICSVGNSCALLPAGNCMQPHLPVGGMPVM